LGDIRGVAQLAANDPDLNEDVCHDLGKIVKSTLYAREIKKVLYFGRQTHPKETQTNLNKLIGEWIDLFEFANVLIAGESGTGKELVARAFRTSCSAYFRTRKSSK
jgi:hypothetical protein